MDRIVVKRFNKFCVGAALWGLLVFLISSAIVKANQPQPWEQKHEQLRQQWNIVFTCLEEVHAALVVRVQGEAPALLTRLSLDPPKARATGHGLLPVILDNAPQITVLPTQTFYSLRWLEERLEEAFQEVEKLAGQVPDAIEIEPLVSSFERSLMQLRNLEANLNYHEQWQQEVVRSPGYFRNKNRLVALARQMNMLITNNESPQRVAELRGQLVRSVTSFRPTSGLTILYLDEGQKVLPVMVCTDIEDQDFLQAFSVGVQEAFSRSQAARAYRFSVGLKWRMVGADSLYPNGASIRGTRIDMNTHRALFQDCPLVLTTGASSTSAMVGDRIFLGTEPVSRRTLAHEFGHLLGFEDAYLRGYDGEPGDAYGVVIVEWTGLTADLMGDSARGSVSEEMISTLINAYGALVVE